MATSNGWAVNHWDLLLLLAIALEIAVSVAVKAVNATEEFATQVSEVGQAGTAYL